MNDADAMRRAIELAASVRGRTSPNPWVGAYILPCEAGGATEPSGARHAEAVALDNAGDAARCAVMYVTLEPCAPFEGKRTPSCAEAIIAAGIERVVVGMEDPDPRVAGRGIAALREAGVEVEVGVCDDEVRDQLAAYTHHRHTGRPYVVLKLAATLDGRTAAPDGTSQWITGHEARTDAHRLRAESDAVLVGQGTILADDPSLTVRLVDGENPRRIVLGHAPPHAKAQPVTEVEGELEPILDRLGAEGVVQLLVEGGAAVAYEFHSQGLVDRYVLYLAPALFGGDDGRGLFVGTGAQTIDDVWRGRFVSVRRVGADLRVDVEPVREGA